MALVGARPTPCAGKNRDGLMPRHAASARHSPRTTPGPEQAGATRSVSRQRWAVSVPVTCEQSQPCSASWWSQRPPLPAGTPHPPRRHRAARSAGMTTPESVLPGAGQRPTAAPTAVRPVRSINRRIVGGSYQLTNSATTLKTANHRSGHPPPHRSNRTNRVPPADRPAGASAPAPRRTAGPALSPHAPAVCPQLGCRRAARPLASRSAVCPTARLSPSSSPRTEHPAGPHARLADAAIRPERGRERSKCSTTSAMHPPGRPRTDEPLGPYARRIVGTSSRGRRDEWVGDVTADPGRGLAFQGGVLVRRIAGPSHRWSVASPVRPSRLTPCRIPHRTAVPSERGRGCITAP